MILALMLLSSEFILALNCHEYMSPLSLIVCHTFKNLFYLLASFIYLFTLFIYLFISYRVTAASFQTCMFSVNFFVGPSVLQTFSLGCT